MAVQMEFICHVQSCYIVQFLAAQNNLLLLDPVVYMRLKELPVGSWVLAVLSGKTIYHIILGCVGGIACKSAVQFLSVSASSGSINSGPVLVSCLQVILPKLLCFDLALGPGLGMLPHQCLL